MGYSSTDEVITSSQIPMFLDELKDLGNDTIIIGQTRYNSSAACATSASQFRWVEGFPSKLGTILNAAQARGMKVYVGTSMASRNCWNFWVGSTSAVVADVQQSVSSLASSYGSHPAFAGWYIPDEPGPVPATTHTYYQSVTSALKTLTPTKPVAVAPYIGAGLSPASIASAALSFRNLTGVDLQIWQDGIGANNEARLFHWTTPGYHIEQYYQALSGVLGSGLWADVELFNHGNPLFIQTASGLTGAYRPASVQRVNQQLWSSRFAAKSVSWLHQWHSSEVIGPSRGYVEAPRMMGVYRAFYGLGNTLTFPTNHSSYTWLSSVSPTYPDSGAELFDRRTGNPRDPTDPAWIGINGAARVRIDLGTTKPIDWIGVHTLTKPEWGVRSPVNMEIFCGSSATNLARIHTATAPFTQASLSASLGEEYVLSNRAPLNASCRFIELRMPNGYWTFLSEIEASSE